MASDASLDNDLAASGAATTTSLLDKDKGNGICQAPAVSPMRPAGTDNFEMLSRPFELTGAFGNTAFVQMTGPPGSAFPTGASLGSQQYPQSVYASTSQQQQQRQTGYPPVFPLPLQHGSFINHQIATCFVPQSYASSLYVPDAAMLARTVDAQHHAHSLDYDYEQTPAQPSGIIAEGTGGNGHHGCGIQSGHHDKQAVHDARPSPHAESPKAIPPDAGRNFDLVPEWAHYGLQFHIGNWSPSVEEGERTIHLNMPHTGGCGKGQDERILT